MKRNLTRLLSIRPHLIPSLATALLLMVAAMGRVYHKGGLGYSPVPGRIFGRLYDIPSYYSWGFFDLKDGYFMLLRWVVMVVSLYLAYKGYQWKKIRVTWLFGFSAILFNPIVQITFARETWRVFDALCALAFLAAGFLLKEPDITKKT